MINYYLITKPGIIIGNLITVAAGFALGTKGQFDIWTFLSTVLGIALIIASACVFNNYIDMPLDKKMERTKNRPLVQNLISTKNALSFGSLLGLFGMIILFFFTNFVATLVAGIGFFVYVCLYSIWKGKTVYGTAIGSIAGAVPPVVGYTAASGEIDLAALILFSMMIFWQMPHFFAITLYHLEDYKNAKIPVLPLYKGILRTKTHMFFYIIAFMLSASLLTYFKYTGGLFLFVSLTAGIIWLIFSLLGFIFQNDKLWGKQMFRISLLVISAICLLIPFDKV